MAFGGVNGVDGTSIWGLAFGIGQRPYPDRGRQGSKGRGRGTPDERSIAQFSRSVPGRSPDDLSSQIRGY